MLALKPTGLINSARISKRQQVLNSKQTAKLANAYNRLAESDRAKLAGLPLQPLASLALFNRLARQLPDRAIGAYENGADLESSMLALADKFEIPALIAHKPTHWQSLPGWPQDEKAQTLFALDAVTKADPDNLNSVPQIVKWLRHPQHAALPEDLPGIRDDLRAFERIKLTLPQEQQQLGHYPHIQALRRALPQTNASIEQRQLYEQKALTAGDAQLLWRDENNDHCLIHITSERGAQQMGRHTDWCTAWGGPDDPKKTSKFSSHSDDLLYLRKGSNIFQLHFRTSQFKDALDGDVSLAQLVADLPEMLPHLSAPLNKAMNTLATKGWGEELTDLAQDCWQTGDEALQQVTIKSLKKNLPTAMSAMATDGQVSGMTELAQACWQTGDEALQQITIESLNENLPTIMEDVVAPGSFDDIIKLAKTCWQTGDEALQQTILESLNEHLPAAISTMTTSSRTSSQTINLARFCWQIADEDLQHTVRESLNEHLPTAMSTMANNGWGREMADLAQLCWQTDDKGLQLATLESLKKHLPATMRRMESDGLGNHMAELAQACWQTGNATLQQATVELLRENLPATMRKMANNGWGNSMADLAQACWQTDDETLQQATVELLRENLPATMRKMANEGMGNGMACLAQFCWQIGDAGLVKAVRDSMQPHEAAISALAADYPQLRAALDLYKPETAQKSQQHKPAINRVAFN